MLWLDDFSLSCNPLIFLYSTILLWGSLQNFMAALVSRVEDHIPEKLEVECYF